MVQVSTEDENEKCSASSLRYWKAQYTPAACKLECESDFIDEVCRCHRIQVPVDPRLEPSQPTSFLRPVAIT